MIELDKDTDDLLQKVALAEDELDPELLREVIPDREAFVSYITQRGLLNDPSAQSILATLDATRQSTKKAVVRKGKGSRVAPATLARMIDEVVRKTGFKKQDIHPILDKLLTPTGHLVPRWHKRVNSLLRGKGREQVAARSGNGAKPKRPSRKARRRVK